MEQTMGERIRMLRKRRGMTQGELAEALGVTVQTIVRYEGLRKAEMRSGRLEAIAAALRVSVEDLTGEKEDREEQEIQILTRGLRNMEPAQREYLIRLMMPLVLQYQMERKATEGQEE